MKIFRPLLVLALILGSAITSACTAVPDPTITPIQPLAEVVTVEVVRPSPTATATATEIWPSATPLPSATITPTRPRPEEIESTLLTDPREELPPFTPSSLTPVIPTRRPTVTPTPDPNISLVVLSSQGQLAFIQNEILYVETAPLSGEFKELGQFARAAAWSPDGRQLVYSLSNTPGPYDDAAIYEQRLWTAVDNTDISLADIIPDYPEPPYQVQITQWSPDGTKMVFTAGLDEQHQEKRDSAYQTLMAIVDLNEGTITDFQFLTYNERIVWLTNQLFILQSHCGTPCKDYYAYDYSGQFVWPHWWGTAGFVDFASQGNFWVNIGPLVIENQMPTSSESQPASVYEIDMTSGEATLLWEATVPPEESYFEQIWPHISPDEQFVSFNFGEGDIFRSPGTLYVIGRDGRELWQYPNSYVLDWGPNDDLAVVEILESEESQVVLLSLDGTAQTITTVPADTEIGDMWREDIGRWSPDGDHLIFATEDSTHLISQVYLWQRGMVEPQLIHTLNSKSSFQNFTWSPDGKKVYFTSGETAYWLESIWQYDVETGVLTEIAGQHE